MLDALKTDTNSFAEASLPICSNCKHKTTHGVFYVEKPFPSFQAATDFGATNTAQKADYCGAVKLRDTEALNDPKVVTFIPLPLCKQIASSEVSCAHFAETPSLGRKILSLLPIKFTL